MRLILPFKVFKNDRGNVALITAFLMLPLTFLVGMSVDLSNATRVRVALQDATDSAALAIARNASNITVGNESTAAYNYVGASFQKNVPYSATATLDRTTLTARVTSQAQVPTTFSAMLGKSQLAVSAFSEVKGQGYNYEIVMVLDNSGSMTSSLGQGSTKIAELKKAATALLDAMMTEASSGKVKIGIVPFSSAVNVGAANSGASWIDTGGSSRSSYYWQSFNNSNTPQTLNRLQLNGGHTDGLRSTTWGGCVESRPIKDSNGVVVDWDIDDTTPTTAKSDTLFVPWFAPDEPDAADDWSSDSYSNNYLSDSPSGCSGTNTPEGKQERYCKYRRRTPSGLSSGKGPNFNCDSEAITPLTATRATLNTAVTAMVAEGNTNVPEGFAWGWRALSPTAPFTEGEAYTTKNLVKVIILMTDGQNNIPARDTHNLSIYSSYGYMKDGRLGTNLNTTSKITAEMDKRLTLSCTKAKAAGITVYTVALGSDADATLLKGCASKESYAYAPTNGSDLTPVFESIAASINKLRLTQ